MHAQYWLHTNTVSSLKSAYSKSICMHASFGTHNMAYLNDTWQVRRRKKHLYTCMRHYPQDRWWAHQDSQRNIYLHVVFRLLSNITWDGLLRMRNIKYTAAQEPLPRQAVYICNQSAQNPHVVRIHDNTYAHTVSPPRSTGQKTQI